MHGAKFRDPADRQNSCDSHSMLSCKKVNKRNLKLNHECLCTAGQIGARALRDLASFQRALVPPSGRQLPLDTPSSELFASWIHPVHRSRYTYYRCHYTCSSTKLSKVSSFRRQLHFNIHVKDHGNSDVIFLVDRLTTFDGGAFDLIITGSDVAIESVEVE